MPQSVYEERFLAKVTVSDTGCHLWTGATMTNGYGRFGGEGRAVLAHRWAYEHFIGPIPEGLELDHLCRVRNCVNPFHLEPVTGAENRRRGEGFAGRQSRQTACKHGHPLDEENTYVWRGQRKCRTCNRIRSQRLRDRRKEMSV